MPVKPVSHAMTDNDPLASEFDSILGLKATFGNLMQDQPTVADVVTSEPVVRRRSRPWVYAIVVIFVLVASVYFMARG